jgi:hypothetical protein
MRTIGQSWKQAMLVMAVFGVGAWLVVPQGRADETEKPKVEKKDKDSAALKKQQLKTLRTQQGAFKKLIAEQEKAKKTEEEERNSDPAWKPSHEETAVIKINEGTNKPVALNNFCLNTDGNILAACGGERLEYTQNKKTGEYEPKTIGEPAEIRVLSPEGKLLKTWPLEFKPEAVCVADDGTIFVAGGGRMAKLNQEGKILLAAASPQMADLPPMPPLPEKKEPTKEDEAAKTAREKKVAELKSKLEKAQKAYREAIKENKLPKNATQEQAEAFQKKLKEPMAALIAAQQEFHEANLSPEMLAMQKRAEIQQKAAVTGIATSKDDVFVACSMTKGYGYAVWRVDRDFAKPKQIIEGLRGCCGQMDVQAKDGEVWIPHNAAHKVERFDRDGKKLLSFGTFDRKKADGFGGCCEPKNLRFGPKGELYASESGPPVAIKRFTTDGKFLGVVGLPTYKTGCVRVTVDISRDGRTVYILSPGENAIHVLSAKPAKSDEKAEPTK